MPTKRAKIDAPSTPTLAARTASSKPKKVKARMSLADAMGALEAAGTEQTRKTWRRFGGAEPMFGVSYAMLQTLRKAIGIDHELARALWQTGNLDARNLALKVADPAQMTTTELDHWAQTVSKRGFGDYVAALAVAGARGPSRAAAWLESADVGMRELGWTTVGSLALNDEDLADGWFLDHLARIESGIHGAHNDQRLSMLRALIAIGCRTPSLRLAATAAIQRIGPVAIDHGDNSCKTPDAVASIDKAWAHSLSKGFSSPAAHERAREPLRLRC